MFDESGKFEGFGGNTWTAIPDLIFDYFLAHLTGAEFKVICYIARWTCGFQHRPVTAIPKDQMVNGFVSRSGKRVDCGAGVSARMLTASSKDKNGNVTPNVLDRLENMGLITRDRTFGPGIKSRATRYSLNILPNSPLADKFGFEPQDVAPAKLPPLIETGEEQVPPLSPRKSSPLSEESKESDRETTTTTDCGSGTEDSTDVEETETEESLEVYHPRHFSVPSKEAVRDYLNQAGSLGVLNDSLETLDRKIGSGDEIGYRHGYLLSVIKRKRQEASHLGPAPEPKAPALVVDPEPEKNPEELAAGRKVSSWIYEFRHAHPTLLPSPESTDLVKSCALQGQPIPDPEDLKPLPGNHLDIGLTPDHTDKAVV